MSVFRAYACIFIGCHLDRCSILRCLHFHRLSSRPSTKERTTAECCLLIVWHRPGVPGARFLRVGVEVLLPVLVSLRRTPCTGMSAGATKPKAKRPIAKNQEPRAKSQEPNGEAGLV